MEDRVRLFQDLHANPWFNGMNWVLDELRCPPDRRRSHYMNTGCFYNLPRITFTNRRLGKV